MRIAWFLAYNWCMYGSASAARLEMRATTATATLTIQLPSEGTAFTSTVSACGTVGAFVVVGLPNGTFFPGTQTIQLPPQASGTTSTFINTISNATQVIIATPLPGTCAPISIPISGGSEGTEPSGPSPSEDPCPLEGCTKGVNNVAETIVEAINQVTIVSQSLQSVARQLGLGKRGSYQIEARDLFSTALNLIRGLMNIAPTLTTLLPSLQNQPPFPPGCNSDTIVVALIYFVRVHQALLQLLIGQSGAFSIGSRSSVLTSPSGPQFSYNDIPDDLKAEFFDAGFVSDNVHDDEKFSIPGNFNPFGPVIAGILRSIESVVDDVAFGLIALIPTHQQCLNQQKFSIDGTLNDAIKAYGS